MLKNDREFTGTLLGFDDFVSEFASFQNLFAFFGKDIDDMLFLRLYSQTPQMVQRLKIWCLRT